MVARVSTKRHLHSVSREKRTPNRDETDFQHPRVDAFAVNGDESTLDSQLAMLIQTAAHIERKFVNHRVLEQKIILNQFHRLSAESFSISICFCRKVYDLFCALFCIL